MKKTLYSSFLLILFILLFLPVSSQPWFNNRLGIDNDVPATWSALKVVKANEQITVKCWVGITFLVPTSANSLIKQLMVSRQPILNIPVQYRIDNENTGLAKHINKHNLKKLDKVQLLIASKISRKLRINI